MDELYGPSLRDMKSEDIELLYGQTIGIENGVDQDSILLTISLGFSGAVGSFLGSYFVSNLAKCG